MRKSLLSIKRVLTAFFCLPLFLILVAYLSLDIYRFIREDFATLNDNGYVEEDGQSNRHFFANDITDGSYVIDFRPVYFHTKARYEFDFKLRQSTGSYLLSELAHIIGDPGSSWMAFWLYVIGKDWFFEEMKSKGKLGPKIKIALYKKGDKQPIFSNEDHLFKWDVSARTRTTPYFRGHGVILMPNRAGYATSLCHHYITDKDQEYTRVF